MATVFNFGLGHYHRSHVSHMRIDRFRHLSGYHDPSVYCFSLQDLLVIASQWLFNFVLSPWILGLNHFDHSRHQVLHSVHLLRSASDSSKDHDSHPGDPDLFTSDILPAMYLSHSPALRLHGGHESDEDSDSDLPRPSSKRKRKVSSVKPRKSNNKGKGKGRAEPESETELGLRVTVGKGRDKGMYVEEVVQLDYVPELWFIPHTNHPIAHIVDLSDSPECLEPKTIDVFIKKQCQDSSVYEPVFWEHPANIDISTSAGLEI
ncbi:hypothetical protein DFH09DRAFT_1088950 [Mycena vulgaris]|nr:hypothetical protein DFH09DRAFT_1088950 [Mycena vulgaris]